MPIKYEPSDEEYYIDGIAMGIADGLDMTMVYEAYQIADSAKEFNEMVLQMVRVKDYLGT